MRKLILLVAPLALAVPVAVRAEAAAPAFSCGAARTEVERTICAHPELAREDAAMARLYAAAKRGAGGDGQSNQGAVQLAWLRDRAVCEAFNRSAYANRAECLMSSYRERNIALATAALFADRDFALSQLRRLDPKSVPLVEALVRYADHLPGSRWTAPALADERGRIAALLREPFARLQREPMQGYGYAILKDSVPVLDAAFASDTAFADTVATLAGYADGEQTPIVMPCAALVRNPALTAMLTPRFGSTLDNFLPRTDCAAALPPMPAFEALQERISDTWPDCEGTIRFAAYRGYDAAVERARIGFEPVATARPQPLRRLRGVPQQLVPQAVAALEQAYRLHGGLTPAQASATARLRVADMLAAAHSCGEY